MDSDFHFGPARSGELTAYGARTPDASLPSIFEWADFMRAQRVVRVCCLVDTGQLAGFPVNLEAEYKRLFGATCVLMEPIADHHLCSRQTLRGNILPFLKAADRGSERVVIHCWGGNGRTGHVLATWLWPHGGYPRWTLSRRWKQLDDYRRRLFWRATRLSTN